MPRRIGNARWRIAGLLGTGILINYFDRINISVATKPFEQEFHVSSGVMGIIISAYLWSYVLLQVPVGVLLDRFGVKWLVRIGTFLWGLASYMTAIVSGLGLVILSRVILGAAEAPMDGNALPPPSIPLPLLTGLDFRFSLNVQLLFARHPVRFRQQ